MKTLSVFAVALHPEGVDRNVVYVLNIWLIRVVALHPEGVDRNVCVEKDTCKIFRVALHPEGVDRNDLHPRKNLRKLCRPPPGGRG